MLLVVSMSSHDLFIISNIVNVSEKQKYISIVVVVVVVVVLVPSEKLVPPLICACVQSSFKPFL